MGLVTLLRPWLRLLKLAEKYPGRYELNENQWRAPEIELQLADIGLIYCLHRREFWEAVKLGKFADPELGFAEITSQRNFGNKSMPNKVISTIHKAKGLESDHVIVTAFDRGNFPDTEEKRCLLYVALSRAKHSVTIIASKNTPSPLLRGL